MTVVNRIISGGQTGVDRAALDVALELGIPCGGWCPAGRRAEDGTINARYPLKETPSRAYRERTEWNFRDADGTLILSPMPLTGGTALTRRLARRMNKPLLIIDIDERLDAASFHDWITQHDIATLNIAGPRESQCPGIYERALAKLRDLLRDP